MQNTVRQHLDVKKDFQSSLTHLFQFRSLINSVEKGLMMDEGYNRITEMGFFFFSFYFTRNSKRVVAGVCGMR